jgi:hypothetical protein
MGLNEQISGTNEQVRGRAKGYQPDIDLGEAKNNLPTPQSEEVEFNPLCLRPHPHPAPQPEDGASSVLSHDLIDAIQEGGLGRSKHLPSAIQHAGGNRPKED